MGIDGSEKSLEAADYSMSIAKNMNAELIILNVLETEYNMQLAQWFHALTISYSDLLVSLGDASPYS